MHATKRRLLEKGLQMLLEHGYNDLGIDALLKSTGTPKGSFYHHFQSKEDFALQVIDLYMEEVHAGLDASLGDASQPPLARVRGFFEMTHEKYRSQGYLGCMLGGIGQELSGASEVFRHRIEQCFTVIGDRLATCLEEARAQGQLPEHVDARQMADLLVHCWEGAALRTRLQREGAALDAMLDFYFASAASAG